MSMSDTAEYWWDIKNRSPYLGPEYYHHPTYNCSHINTTTSNTKRTPYIGDINCGECMKYITENGVEGLKLEESTPDFYMTKTAAKRYRREERERKAFELLYGKCSCGNSWAIRVNSKTKQKFLGCTNYPKCKNSKSIKD